MSDSISSTIKLLIKNVSDLTQEIRILEEKIRALEENQNSCRSVPVQGLGWIQEENETRLDLPLSRLLQVYGELPQVLEPACRRVAVVMDYDGERPVLDRNPQGNYWVLKLRQNYFLFPRPGAFVKLVALESLQNLFDAEGKTPDISPQEFMVKKPAKLDLLKRHERWQLVEKGQIRFGEASLEFKWQEEIQTLRDEYRQFNNLLKTVGEAGLEAALTTQHWQQQLHLLYGPPVSIIINTCMPIAYAVYKGPMLVPCNVITARTCLVLPAWDRGLPWETSIYAKFHSKHNKDVLRSRKDHPVLPNQPYLKEINWETNHTWAIVNSYDEASAVVTRLNDNWGPLD
ncbi:hypothetical protein [Synechocystis sp. LKSZ1]|uniref:hypothetical protein n=1 Tax=Synechocystis sp. LKSZ1 TaxID=3144951 RepID=UPI00336BC39E